MLLGEACGSCNGARTSGLPPLRPAAVIIFAVIISAFAYQSTTPRRKPKSK